MWVAPRIHDIHRISQINLSRLTAYSEVILYLAEPDRS
jgi:hypothetical protein